MAPEAAAMILRVLILTAFLIGGAGSTQQPWRGQNLEYFPKEIPRPELLQQMREFSFALGVRCQHCHTGGDGVSLEGVDFASDAKPAKLKARAMLRMVDQLNGPMLAAIPSRAEPRVEISCVTCHRGLPLPKTLQTTLFEIVERDGAAPAVARYRELRETSLTSGQYDFTEWEMNELARRLAEAGNRRGAIAMLELNGEFHPKSPSIAFQLGELYLAEGDRVKALDHFRRTIALAPQHDGAKRRIAQIGGGQLMYNH
jgi:hypothetical protein